MAPQHSIHNLTNDLLNVWVSRPWATYRLDIYWTADPTLQSGPLKRMNQSESSKEELRDFLYQTLDLQPVGAWQLAAQTRVERAGEARPLAGEELKTFLKQITSAHALGLFMGHAPWGEILDLESNLKKLLGKNCPPVAYPRYNPNTKLLEFAFCRSTDTVLKNGWKAAPAEAPLVKPDVLFIPGALMDSSGNRLGRGSGGFDRYLEHHLEPLRIGVIHSRFVVEEFSNQWIEPHDIPMDVLWTERGVYKTPQYRRINKERAL